MPVLELGLLIPLVVTRPLRITDRTVNLRWLSIGLITLVNAANAASVVLLVRYLLHGGQTNGRTLIRAGIGIWVTQVLVFALWCWEMDRGGPVARCSSDHGPPDLAVHPDATAGGHDREVVSPVLGLSLPFLDQLDRVQPHRHVAPHSQGC